MKTNSHLLLEHLSPYTEGYNVLRYTNTGDDIFVGEIEKILPVLIHHSLVSRVTIRLNWLQRIIEMSIDTLSTDDPIIWHKEGVPRRHYSLTFEDPRMRQKRSPLIFTSSRETVELSHVTYIAQKVLRMIGSLEINKY